MMSRPAEMPSGGQDDQQRPMQTQRSSPSTTPATSTTTSYTSANSQIPQSSPALQQQPQQQQQQHQQENLCPSLASTTPSSTVSTSSGSVTTSSTANSGSGPNPPNHQPIPQQQQQQQHQQQPTQQQQSREINTATVCKIGQETVQEIVGRIQEVFNYLRTLQPPVGNPTTDRATLEKQQRLNEVLKGITQLFKRLHVCWDKAQEHTTGEGNGSMEHTNIEALVPLKDGSHLPDVRGELEKRRGDAYRVALEEHNELVNQLVLKNKHLKEIIDQMRNLIWEINTMLAMREG